MSFSDPAAITMVGHAHGKGRVASLSDVSIDGRSRGPVNVCKDDSVFGAEEDFLDAEFCFHGGVVLMHQGGASQGGGALVGQRKEIVGALVAEWSIGRSAAERHPRH